MDTERSLYNVKDFEDRLNRLECGDEGQEEFIRELTIGIAENCPLHYLLAMARVVLAMRKAELKQAGETN